MWVYKLDPTLLHLGPLEIRWYGLVYVLGFFLGLWWLQRHREEVGLSKDDVWDLLFYLMLGLIIGARLFEIFWEPQYYLSSFTNIFKIWQGGMSFHGGLVGSFTAAWIYCKKKKINFWKVADILSVPGIFALALGRVANFVNGELIGRAWNGPWCVVFPDYDDLCRHPSTLYAAAKRFVIFGWLLFLQSKNKLTTFKPGRVVGTRDLSLTTFKPGFIFLNLVFWEGLGRFIVDFYRQDILYWSLSLGQWFSLAMIVAALWIFLKHYKGQLKLG
ncbi:prolipoprotein diacylglyceryl transferase [Candidatus Woesearchaeota archaeon CG10_big_fil_rev_8_21_14_0_10_45_16]|nr:MAG: prolipoprotein diacylglyceryl transferase [Candidatus Woesearchaeota archaeon CG10_big_fil_rev_8_21_14_0_10_45_16]